MPAVNDITASEPSNDSHPRQPAARILLRCLPVILLAASQFGCETTPGPSTPSVSPEAPDSAEQLMIRASQADPVRASLLYLEAGRAFLEGAELPDIERAGSAFDRIEPGLLPTDRLPDYHLLAAAIALDRNDPDTAERMLEQLPGPVRNSDRGAELIAELCAQQGNFQCALERLVTAAGDATDLNDRIWALLDRAATIGAPEPPISSSASTADAQLESWQSLHRISISNRPLDAVQTDIEGWIRRHPDHPAALSPPAALERLRSADTSELHVGLLLPLSGPLVRAGEAVRDGFVSTALLGRVDRRFRLTIYDSEADPLPVIYERVLSDGVDLIVGPLSKATVVQMNALDPDVPTLLLNYLDEGQPPARNVRQLGLAIEDEAATILSRLERDGIRSPLLFHNYDDWSLRAERTVERGWSHAMTVQPLTDLRTITEAVGEAMLVSDSEARRDELATVLGYRPEFLPRARTDVDGVIALVDNVEANALVPALTFHFANHLPVYASSQVTRTSRRERLNELSGFRISELPWFLADNRTYAALNGALSLDDHPFASLVALGSDAFRVAERLAAEDADPEPEVLPPPSAVETIPEPTVAVAPEQATGGGAAASSADIANRAKPIRHLVLLGSTGLLRLAEDGSIHRELAWGRVSGTRVLAEQPEGPVGISGGF